MFIKTVSTTSGINPIQFDETGGVFYWILNTGSSTIYASTKAAFTAGDDGVVSLGPKESRRLETNNDTIYILGEGQVEIHNQRDGICSFKQAPTSSGGGETIDAYTKTESDAKYAQKTDIPTSLPANGGNADYAANAGNADTVKNITVIGTAQNSTYNTILEWATNINGFGTACMIVAYGWPSDAPIQQEGLLTVTSCSESTRRVVTFMGYNSVGTIYQRTIWGNNWASAWVQPTAGNADTVDNLHADDFVNATNRNSIQIPSNADVPAWIYANGKRYQIYMTNEGNIGMTNIPNNSIDWVWYWFDGINIIAREWVTGRYYICDMINGSFSGWKVVCASGFKSYVTGAVVVDSNGKANVSFGFNPSFVLYAPTSPKSGIVDSVYSATTFNATGFTPSADTYTGGPTGTGFIYIAFK